jgi:hypothetical protein
MVNFRASEVWLSLLCWWCSAAAAAWRGVGTFLVDVAPFVSELVAGAAALRVVVGGAGAGEADAAGGVEGGGVGVAEGGRGALELP